MRTHTLIVLALLPTGCSKSQKDAERATVQAVERMKKIGLAMHEYEDTYGMFPAGIYTTDNAVGLSWRVAILPFLDQKDLHKQFKLDEQWDSPHNRALVEKMPDVFASPGATAAAGHTFVRGFATPTGPPVAVAPVVLTPTRSPRAFFPGPVELKGTAARPPGQVVTGRRKAAILDGMSNSIMVVEAAEAVLWTKPEALECDATKPLPMLGAGRGGFLGLMCDGSVRVFPENVSHASLRCVILVNDGNPLPPDINAPLWNER